MKFLKLLIYITYNVDPNDNDYDKITEGKIGRLILISFIFERNFIRIN